jgi:hypothetical protein
MLSIYQKALSHLTSPLAIFVETTDIVYMTKTTKNLLILSIVCLLLGLLFVTGILNAQSMVALYVTLPLGAVFFGLFLIFRMLGKESSLYDEEQKEHSVFKAVKANAIASEKGCGCSSPAHETAAARH